MAVIPSRMFRASRSQPDLRSPRRWSRFIGLLKWKEFFTLIFYACMTISSLGGALFFGVRSLQGYRKGLTFFYLSMLLFMSFCSLVCHLLLIKWRLDRFFHEFARSKPRQLRRSVSTEGETEAEQSSFPEAAISASVHAAVVSSERNNNSGFVSRLKAILKLFHAYAVFLVALVISLLVLFDLATGYTASHFRPTLFSVISLTSLQCWVVAVSFAWFITVLVFNDATDATEVENPFECSITEFSHQETTPSNRDTRRSSSRTSGWRCTGGVGERRHSRRGRDLSDEEMDNNNSGRPQHVSKSNETVVREKEDTSMWDVPASDVSTCALATIRGVSSQWGDAEEAEAGETGAGGDAENVPSGMQAQGDFRGVSIQPTVIGMPSFAIACMPPVPLALDGEGAQIKDYSTVHHSRV